MAIHGKRVWKILLSIVGCIVVGYYAYLYTFCYVEGPYPKVPIPKEFFSGRSISIGDRMIDIADEFNDSIRQTSYPGPFCKVPIWDYSLTTKEDNAGMLSTGGINSLDIFGFPVIPIYNSGYLWRISFGKRYKNINEKQCIDIIREKFNYLMKCYGQDMICSIIPVYDYNTNTQKYSNVVVGYTLGLDWFVNNRNSVSFVYSFEYKEGILNLCKDDFNFTNDTTRAFSWNITMDKYNPTSEEKVEYQKYLRDKTKVHVYRGFQSFDSVWTTIKNGTWSW